MNTLTPAVVTCMMPTKSILVSTHIVTIIICSPKVESYFSSRC